MRPNYNYNYNYAVASSNTQKPHSANPYIKAQDQKYSRQSTAHYATQDLPLKYYPINDDEPAFRTVHSAKESSGFFSAHNKQKQSNLYNDYTTTKSPKSHENWYLPHNKSSQISHKPSHPNRSVNLAQKNQNSTEVPLDAYVTWLHEAFKEFQKTGNPKVLKQINEQNRLEIQKLYQQLLSQNSSNQTPPNQLQATPGSSPRPSTPLASQGLSQIKHEISTLQNQSLQLSSIISQQTRLSHELQHQFEQQSQSRQDNRLDQSHIRESNHLKQMQESIVQLEEEIKMLQRKNNQLAKGIGNLTFFKEWSIMYDEAKGASKLNLKLKHQIAKRENLIKELTNEDPSNNSDVRSVRRLPSENSQKPSFKKQPKSIPSPLIKPQSQLSYKFNEKPDSSRSNDVIVRHLSHSNRFSQSKKTSVNNSVDKNKQRKQSYDQKIYPQSNGWKNMAFAQNLKNLGLNFIGKDVYK